MHCRRKAKTQKGGDAYPSDYFLDPAELTKFSKTVRQELQSSVKDIFHIELNADSPGEESLNEVSRARQDAFRLARFALLKARVETYSQQFQGLYALMRGLAGAFWMGSAYMLGWSMSSISDPYVHCLKLAGCVGLATAVTIALWLTLSQPRPSTRDDSRAITIWFSPGRAWRIGGMAWVAAHCVNTEPDCRFRGYRRRLPLVWCHLFLVVQAFC